MKFFRVQSKSRRALVLDIGISRLSGFTIAGREGRTPETSAPVEMNLGFPESSRLAWRVVMKSLGEMLSLLKKKAGALGPDRLLFVLSAPWYVPYTRTIKMARPEPFVVAPALLDELISQEIEFLKRKSAGEFTEYHGSLLAESRIMKAVLNGYTVRDPVHKRTAELELAFYASLVPAELAAEMEDIVRYHFGAIPLTLNSSALALFTALGELMSSEEGFILVDVGGEMTEVSLVRNRILEAVRFFPAGEHFMVRSTASSLGVAPEEARSFLESKGRGVLQPRLTEKIGGLLDEACSRWRKIFTATLEEIGRGTPLPQTLFLLAGGGAGEVIRPCCEAQDLSRFTILGQPFRVLSFLPEELDGRLAISGLDRKDPKMTRSLLLALAFAPALEKPQPEKELELASRKYE